MNTITERLAEAHRDLIVKTVALRRAILGARNGHGASDAAYTAWKEAVAKAAAIYSDVKAQRQEHVVLQAA